MSDLPKYSSPEDYIVPIFSTIPLILRKFRHTPCLTNHEHLGADEFLQHIRNIRTCSRIGEN